MKKLLSFLLVPVCLLLCAVGCGKNDEKLEDGKFYTVTEAYESGYLTREQVMSIAYYHNGGREHNEDIMSESYQPLPKAPEKLSEVTDKAIRKNYLEIYLTQEEEATLSDVKLEEYNGTYNDCVAVMIEATYIGYPQSTHTEKIDGINIYYKDGNEIFIWRN